MTARQMQTLYALNYNQKVKKATENSVALALRLTAIRF
jgi:hypothetical protein